MTAVCSVGLDMIAVPGDTSADTISAIIADEAAIGMVNSKTTAVRVIPAIGMKEGDTLEFGGLFGSGPVMKLSKFSRQNSFQEADVFPHPYRALKTNIEPQDILRFFNILTFAFDRKKCCQ